MMTEAKGQAEQMTDMPEHMSAPQQTKRWTRIEIVGVLLVIAATLTLLISPNTLSGVFDSIVESVFPVVVEVFLTGTVGVAIITSVIIGRILERLGFTDALMRIFVPFTRLIKINSAVVIPSIYNILGDINAAGKIAAPILVRSQATKSEQKIAIATMVQSQQSFSTFMLGMLAMTTVGINVFPVIILVVFLPVVVVPFILSKTIYRETKYVRLEELPKFTPTTRMMPTVFNAAREGAELLLLLIIPAAAVVFTLIGILDYAGIWSPIETGISSFLSALSIDPETGIVSILASPTLAMGMLAESAANIDPYLVLGSFVLASSGLPLATVFGQIPVVWAASSDLNEREAMFAAVLGAVMRLITAALVALLLGPLVV